MRSVLGFIVVALSMALGAAATFARDIEVTTNPNNYSIEPKATAHLQAPQAVSLVNGYRNEAHAKFRLRGGVLLVEAKQLTDTAIVMLTRALEKQGISVTPDAQKTVTLQVRPQSVMFQLFRYTGRVTLVARLGDGKEANIPQESLSPKGWENAFDGAVLFALNELLEHENFVAYMNNRAAPPLAAAPPAATAPSTAADPPNTCGEGSPETWTDCVGTLTAANGSHYVGDFKDGKYHGQGTLVLKSGSRYVGDFRDGKMNGQITFTAPNGAKYVGEFKDDRMHGQGIATRADGSVIHSGTWANSKPVK